MILTNKTCAACGALSSEDVPNIDGTCVRCWLRPTERKGLPKKIASVDEVRLWLAQLIPTIEPVPASMQQELARCEASDGRRAPVPSFQLNREISRVSMKLEPFGQLIDAFTKIAGEKFSFSGVLALFNEVTDRAMHGPLASGELACECGGRRLDESVMLDIAGWRRKRREQKNMAHDDGDMHAQWESFALQEEENLRMAKQAEILG